MIVVFLVMSNGGNGFQLFGVVSSGAYEDTIIVGEEIGVKDGSVTNEFDDRISAEQTEPDFGDAPAPYPTYFIDGGAYHETFPDPNYYLGLLVDIELDGQPDIDALGDDINGFDDEDGVSFLTPLIPGESATIEVLASKEGYLNAWLDFDGINEWD